MKGPLGAEVEWDAETTRLDENERVAWNSKGNSAVKTSGQVTFRPLGVNETEVTVTLQYDPPAGAAGQAVASLFANPERRVPEDLERFKEFVETTSERIRGPEAATRASTNAKGKAGKDLTGPLIEAGLRTARRLARRLGMARRRVELRRSAPQL